MTRRRIEECVALERVRDLLVCDPVAGKLRWRERLVTNWRIKSWNKRFAGQVAGCPNSKGHIQIGLKVDGVKFFVLAHRLIWAMTVGEWLPVDLEIDHRNREKQDNRLSNLRVCTREQNAKNRSLNANNTSGFKGVCWSPKLKKWFSQIGVDGTVRQLGYFSDVVDAVDAYDRAARRLFGEFANTNAAMGLVA